MRPLHHTIAALLGGLLLATTPHAAPAPSSPYGALASVAMGSLRIAGGDGHDAAALSWGYGPPYLTMEGSAAATLAGGTLKSASAVQLIPPNNPAVAEVRSTALMWDTLDFHNGGDGTARLGLFLDIDGQLAGFPWATARVRSYVGYDPDFRSRLDVLAPWQQLGSGDTRLGDDIFALPLGDARVYVYYELETRVRGQSFSAASADFGNTAHIRWVLPAGVSYGSASGIFLDDAIGQPVPEPGSLALMSAGLLAAFVWRRGRARKPDRP